MARCIDVIDQDDRRILNAMNTSYCWYQSPELTFEVLLTIDPT